MNIGVVVDHPKRDLSGIVMIAYALSVRGHSTSIIPLYDQAIDVPLLGLDAIVVNYARPANFDLIQGYVDMGLPVFVLDTEGGVLAENGANSPDRLAEYIRKSGYADLLSGYFFWGSSLYRAFMDGSGMPADRLHLTGCPRFDYASKRWENILEYHRHNYILINTNFPIVNPLFTRTPENEVATMVKSGWTPEYAQKMLIDLCKIMNGYMDIIDRIATKFYQFNFLIRPHPFENSQFYKDRFANFENVVVDGEGSVLNVIRHARCVIHLNCGTAIEANMLGRLPISLEFINTMHMANHSKLPSQVSWIADSYESLCSALEKLPEITKSFSFSENYHKYIMPWFYMNDGMAADRVADALCQSLSSHAARLQPSVFRSMASSRRKSQFGQRLQAVMANCIGSKTVSKMRTLISPVREDKRLILESVSSLLSSITKYTNEKQPIVERAKHPLTRFSMSSLRVTPTNKNLI